jgi:hypothetical protein
MAASKRSPTWLVPRLALARVLLLAACGGGPDWYPPPGTSKADLAAHGSEGDPSDSEGCRRDFCPTAWPSAVFRTGSDADGWMCMCWCQTERTQQDPLGRGMWWSTLPWVPERLPAERARWAEFCATPQP